MAKAEDLTGREFGFLKVISRAPDKITPSGQKRRIWNCECVICGTKKEVAAQGLKRGTAKSCGKCIVPKSRASRNVKICIVCGKQFFDPPSNNKLTCSKECQRAHARQRQTGVTRAAETRAKISSAAQGRDMADLQKIATDAAMKSPKAGRFETNHNAIDWHLISPDGKHYYFHSLNFWLRENCRELFGCEPDSREFKNVSTGISGAKRAMLGGNYSCCTYKGWKVIPTEYDKNKNKEKE